MELNTLRALISGAPLVFVLGAFFCFFAGFLYAFAVKPKPKPFLDKSVQEIQLIDKIPITRDTWRFRFQLPGRNYCLGLPVGSHVKVYCSNTTGTVKGLWNGKADFEAEVPEIERKYTPVTGDDFYGFVDFVVKVYSKNSLSGFPDGGKMSQYFGSLQPGDFVRIAGPFGLIKYKGYGNFEYGQRVLPPKKHVGMVCGGTGLTPMLQVLRSSLSNRRDDTMFWLVYANRTPEDILLRGVLEELEILHPKQFHLWYTVDNLPDDQESVNSWKYSVGFVTKDLLKDHLPPPSTDSVVLLCGPPAMIQFSCRPNLEKLGWQQENILQF